MILVLKDAQFYQVGEICKATTRYIMALNQADRYLSGADWFVHETKIPELFSKAKATGNHSRLDYAVADYKVKGKIDAALGKKSVIGRKEETTLSNLYLTSDAPEWMVEAAWKAFAKNVHPDVGGDPHKFIGGKDAYESYKRDK